MSDPRGEDDVSEPMDDATGTAKDPGGFSPGALRLFHRGPPDSAARVDIRPLPDRLALFWSDERVPHAVLPTGPRHERLAVTFWYFCDDELNRTAAEKAAAWQPPLLRSIRSPGPEYTGS